MPGNAPFLSRNPLLFDLFAVTLAHTGVLVRTSAVSCVRRRWERHLDNPGDST